VVARLVALLVEMMKTRIGVNCYKLRWEIASCFFFLLIYYLIQLLCFCPFWWSVGLESTNDCNNVINLSSDVVIIKFLVTLFHFVMARPNVKYA